MTFDEFKENFDILFEILTTKEKIKILNISFSAIKNKKNSKRVKLFIRTARKEYQVYTERKNFDYQLIYREFPDIEDNYDFISQISEITNDSLQMQSKKELRT